MAKIKLSGRKVCVRNRKLLPCCGQTSPDPCCEIAGQVGFFPLVGGVRPITNTLSVAASQTVSGWNYSYYTPDGFLRKATAPTVTATANLLSSFSGTAADCKVGTANREAVTAQYGTAAFVIDPATAGQTITTGTVSYSGATYLGSNPTSGAGIATFGLDLASIVASASCDYRTTTGGNYSPPFAVSASFDLTRVINRFSMFVGLVGYWTDIEKNQRTAFSGPADQIDVLVDSSGGYAIYLSPSNVDPTSYGPLSGTGAVAASGPGHFTVNIDASQPGFTRPDGFVVPANRLIVAATMTSNMQPCAAPFVPVDGEDPILHFNHVVRNMT